MKTMGAYIDKTQVLTHLEKRLSYFILAEEYEFEPDLSEESRVRLVREYRALMKYVSQMPTHCVMPNLGVERREPFD